MDDEGTGRDSAVQLNEATELTSALLAENEELEEQLDQYKALLEEFQEDVGEDEDEDTLKAKKKELKEEIKGREQHLPLLEKKRDDILEKLEEVEEEIQELQNEEEGADTEEAGKVKALQTEVNELKKKLDAQDTELEDTKLKTSQAQAKKAELRKKLEEAKEDKEESSKDIGNMKQEAGDLVARLKADEEKLLEEAEDIADAEDEVAQLEEDYKELEQRCAKLEAEVDVEAKATELGGLKELLNQKTEEVHQWEEKCLQVRQNLEMVLGTRKGKKTDGGDADGAADQEKAEIEKIKADNDVLRRQLADAESAHEALPPLEKELKEINEKYDALQDELETLERHQQQAQDAGKITAQGKERLLQEIAEEKELILQRTAEVEKETLMYEEEAQKEQKATEALQAEMKEEEQRSARAAQDEMLKDLEQKQEEEWAAIKAEQRQRWDELDEERKKIPRLSQIGPVSVDAGKDVLSEDDELALQRSHDAMQKQLEEIDQFEKEVEQQLLELDRRKDETVYSHGKFEAEHAAECKRIEAQFAEIKEAGAQLAGEMEKLQAVHASLPDTESEDEKVNKDDAAISELEEPLGPQPTTERALAKLQENKLIKKVSTQARKAVLELLPQDALRIARDFAAQGSSIDNPTEFLLGSVAKAKKLREATAQEVREKLHSVKGLSEDAEHEILGLPLPDAMRILEEIAERGDLQDPSAFAMKEARRALHENVPPEKEQMQKRIQELPDLSAQARRVLSELSPTEAGQAIAELESLGLQALNERSECVLEASARLHHDTREAVVQELHTKLNAVPLDERARTALWDLPPPDALRILKQYDEAAKRGEAKDLSTFCYEKATEELLRDGRPTVAEVRAKLRTLPELTEEAQDAVLNLPPEGALVILSHLESKDIQDPSAFVMHAAHRLQQVAEGTADMLTKVRSRAGLVPQARDSHTKKFSAAASSQKSVSSKAASSSGAPPLAAHKGLRDRLIALTAERESLARDHQANLAHEEAHQDGHEESDPEMQKRAVMLEKEAAEIRRGLRWALDEEKRHHAEQGLPGAVKDCTVQ